MGQYAIGVRTVDGTNAAPALEIFTGAVDISTCAPRRKVLKIQITTAGATASYFGIGRPAAIGITPTAPVTLINASPGRPPATVKVATAWATAPTVPAFFFRMAATPGVVGSSMTFDFSDGLWLGAADSIVVWNLAGNALADINVVVEE